MVYYAVAKGRNIGIFTNWNECKLSIYNYKQAIYRKFDTESEAIDFIQQYSDNDFIPDYYVYTDGACYNNGKANAKAGIGIFFDIDDERNISKRIEGKQTNNIAELTALVVLYPIIEEDIKQGKKIAIITDSEYAIKCVTTYGQKCDKKNWDVSIPNLDLVKEAYNIYRDIKNIKFIHIKAHTNNTDIHSVGNYHADNLANNAIK
jgi:ribonuclease HI